MKTTEKFLTAHLSQIQEYVLVWGHSLGPLASLPHEPSLTPLSTSPLCVCSTRHRSPYHPQVKTVLEEVGYAAEQVTPADCAMVYEVGVGYIEKKNAFLVFSSSRCGLLLMQVCELVSRRAADLTAAACATVISRIGQPGEEYV